MKQNTLTKILAAGAVCAFALGTTFAQNSSTTTVTTGGSDLSTTTSTSTMDGTGTITEFTPSSDYITFRTRNEHGAGEVLLLQANDGRGSGR